MIGVKVNLHISEERTVKQYGGERVFHDPIATCSAFECEPGLWFPLSARAEMRERIREAICPDCFTPDDCPAANAVVRLIFGGDHASGETP